MSVQRLIAALPLTVLLLLPSGAATAQEAPTPLPLNVPPGPVTRFPTRFDVVDAPAHFKQVLMIVDFPAGTWTPLHTPGGSVYGTVIEGAISTRTNAGEQANSYQAGDTFVEEPGEYVQIGNSSGASARLMATALLPTNAPLTIYRDGLTSSAYPTLKDWYSVQDINVDMDGPWTFGRSSVEVDRPSGAFELVQLLLDLDPGAATPRHIHGGQEFTVVTAGNVTLQRGDDIHVFGPGESWVNPSGLVHAAGNDGVDLAEVAATFLLPAGRPLTTVG
ncbi:MAG TPA: cupin domain-containing protein [Chloroflexota bacterium]